MLYELQQWMVKGDHTITPGGKLNGFWQRGTISSSDIDIRGFKKCCTLNVENGSEDDLMWDSVYLCKSVSDSSDEEEIKSDWFDEKGNKWVL